ncbi:hypothetical protein QOT17_006802 [Balamuthia mandrillaris]
MKVFIGATQQHIPLATELLDQLKREFPQAEFDEQPALANGLDKFEVKIMKDGQLPRDAPLLSWGGGAPDTSEKRDQIRAAIKAALA